MKNIAILGSTGSIGTQALAVASAHKDKISIKVLAAHSNYKLLEKQIEEFEPDIAVLVDKNAAEYLANRYSGKTKILVGEEGLLEAAIYEKVDTVLTSMVGFAGLKPTLVAIEHGKDIALANKETLVAAGSIIIPAIKKYNCALLPVDSEHSAIFQSLNGEKKKNIGKLILTASGGPFRGKKIEDLKNIKVEDCLKHPNWSMGAKITIDSSTLANKGLEVIEARWLFNVDYDKIEVVVHPQSIIHSMVEYIDGSIIAQLGLPDMKLPIQYAFSYPERWTMDTPRLNFFDLAKMTFEQPDLKTFPALELAFTAGKTDGTMPCVYNAANEQAVNDFMQGKITYLDIPKVIEFVMSKHKTINTPSLEDIIEADKEARKIANEYKN